LVSAGCASQGIGTKCSRNARHCDTVSLSMKFSVTLLKMSTEFSRSLECPLSLRVRPNWFTGRALSAELVTYPEPSRGAPWLENAPDTGLAFA
jgi:hypothetical protein